VLTVHIRTSWSLDVVATRRSPSLLFSAQATDTAAECPLRMHFTWGPISSFICQTMAVWSLDVEISSRSSPDTHRTLRTSSLWPPAVCRTLNSSWRFNENYQFNHVKRLLWLNFSSLIKKWKFAHRIVDCDCIARTIVDTVVGGPGDAVSTAIAATRYVVAIYLTTRHFCRISDLNHEERLCFKTQTGHLLS